MIIRTDEKKYYDEFSRILSSIMDNIESYGNQSDIKQLQKLDQNFKLKIDDFYRNDRKLNIGVIGQVKAGKSSFLNTLLFKGQEILPKASTPKTATLTKMEYSDKNIIHIEYYSEEEWAVLEDNAAVDIDEEIYSSARELVNMIKNNGVDPYPYLKRGIDDIEFDSYDELINSLNDYVGEDGKYTAIVKAVTLYLTKEEFKGLSIVDTPGLNDPIASRTIRTKEFMEVCDVVFFLSQAGSFLDKNDWILLSSQLPQKGVKKLVLVASKYDSGIRDILRKPKEEELIFGMDKNFTDNIPQACKMVKKKLRKRAVDKVEEFVNDLQKRDSSQELINVIRQCSEPLMISSIVNNMTNKTVEEFSPEELNIHYALSQFSNDIEADLRTLGSFDEVRNIFDDVVFEKEKILEEKARSFVPTAKEELKGLMKSFIEKTDNRIHILESNDRNQLEEQKKYLENQIGSVRADISSVFGEVNAKIESEKAVGIRELRSVSKDYLNIRERSGSKTHQESHYVSDSKWFKPWTWGNGHTEYYTYQEHYSYCIAADAIENIKKYAIDSSNQVEMIFSESIQIKEIKRKLLNVVMDNFDLGDEKYDASLFKIMVEETVSSISFPIIDMDISETMNGIAGKFNGELTSASEKTDLFSALSTAISRVYSEISKQLDKEVNRVKNEMNELANTVGNRILSNVTTEFDDLLIKCDDKEHEINGFKEYSALLKTELSNV